ncbi:MAG: Spy/CpxP family protein refolding chaperone [Pseudomonadota bacterium]
MNLRILTALFFAAAMTASPTLAQPSETQREEAAAKMEERIRETAERLDLTEEQKPQVEAILREGIEKRESILKDAGFKEGERPKMRPRQMRKLRGDLQEVSEETTEKLSAVLTDEQMTEYAKIQDERREEMRVRIQGR